MKLELPMIFGEHMVLQRGKEIPVWGKSAAGDIVSVKLGGAVMSAQTAENGEWSLKLPAMEAGENLEFFVESRMTGERVAFHDIAVGEVWLCGGQSNMEFLLKYDEELSDMLETPDDPALRFFRYPCVNFEGRLAIDHFEQDGFWRIWDSEENRKMFGAVPVYMARVLRKELGCPVGMVACNWGGTPAAAWASMEEIENTPEMKPILDWQSDVLKKLDWNAYYAMSELPTPPVPAAQQQGMDNFMMGIGLKEFFEAMAKNPVPMETPVYTPYVPGPRSCVRPAGLYDTMLTKIAPYAIRGAIWYQGEDDDFRDWQDFYAESMKAVIRSWRALWKEELPFFQVELAPFGGRGATAAKRYPDMRAEQHRAAAEMPGAHNVCIMDLGDDLNIHFRNKRKVGERLACLAEKYVYGKDIQADSPEFTGALRDGGSVKISFSAAESGLYSDRSLEDTETTLQVTADGITVHPSEAVSGSLLVLTDPSFDRAGKIRISYAEQNFCRGYLFSCEGFPVFPFHAEV